MDLTKQAAFLNNKGSSLLACGKMPQALTSLKSALHKVQEISKVLSAEEGINIFVEGNIAPSIRFISVDEEVRRFDLEGLFLWTQPIILNRLPRLCTDRDLRSLSAVILFNMALLFHMKQDEKSLRRAFRLYELSFSSVGSIADQGVESCTACIMILCLNNQAHVQYVLGEYAPASETSQALVEAINYCLNLDEAHIRNFSDEKIERMILNAFWMMGDGASPMAAASA